MHCTSQLHDVDSSSLSSSAARMSIYYVYARGAHTLLTSLASGTSRVMRAVGGTRSRFKHFPTRRGKSCVHSIYLLRKCIYGRKRTRARTISVAPRPSVMLPSHRSPNSDANEIISPPPRHTASPHIWAGHEHARSFCTINI